MKEKEKTYACITVVKLVRFADFARAGSGFSGFARRKVDFGSCL